jgi:hypothetical protein
MKGGNPCLPLSTRSTAFSRAEAPPSEIPGFRSEWEHFGEILAANEACADPDPT